MRIVIYGIGKVGIRLAQTLSQEKHAIIIIDQDKKKIEDIQKTMDVLCVNRHIGDEDVVDEAKLKGADIFISVSESDEENVVACMIAKKQGVQKTIARIRNPSYLNKDILDTEQHGIDYIIHPEREVAKEIVRLIMNPWASDSYSFLNNKVLLVEVNVNIDNIGFLNDKLKILAKNDLQLILHLQEDKEHIEFFNARKKVKRGDRIFVLEKRSDSMEINKIFSDVYDKIQDVIILGGGVTGEEILERLEGTKLNIKIIEKDRKRCQELNEKTKQLILCADGTDLNMLLSENLEKADCFIAITADDENNVMTSLFAKQKGVKKVISRVTKAYEEEIVGKVGLDSTVNLNKVTVNKILTFVRQKELIAISILDDDVEVMEFIVNEDSKIFKKQPLENPFIKGAIIGAVYHNDDITFPKKNIKLKDEDRVLVFVHKKAKSSISKYFKSKAKK
ncbi:MAG: Trk system potassium transporter TrkA [Nanoarchaeota archaeon]|nr:Trk system potassium transporter TrkA [Nanoarchaeota archaeon]